MKQSLQVMAVMGSGPEDGGQAWVTVASIPWAVPLLSLTSEMGKKTRFSQMRFALLTGCPAVPGTSGQQAAARKS